VHAWRFHLRFFRLPASASLTVSVEATITPSARLVMASRIARFVIENMGSSLLARHESLPMLLGLVQCEMHVSCHSTAVV
jgi:hypothetical protein